MHLAVVEGGNRARGTSVETRRRAGLVYLERQGADGKVVPVLNELCSWLEQGRSQGVAGLYDSHGLFLRGLGEVGRDAVGRAGDFLELGELGQRDLGLLGHGLDDRVRADADDVGESFGAFEVG